MKNINIGITISIKENDNVWNNGITQNVINFAKLLLNSSNNYNVIIVNTSAVKSIEYCIENIMIKQISEVVKDLDVLFILGSQITDFDYDILKSKRAKIVHYSCGANYFLDAQDVLFRDLNTEKRFYNHIPDESWVIPQNYNSNKFYFETMYRTPSFKIPFIWSPIFLDYVLREYKLGGYYKPSDGAKRIACFEPNIDIVKYALYDILIVEQAYRERPELIKHFYITNSDRIKNNKFFESTMNRLDVVRNGVASFEARFRMPYFLETYTDVVISHQIENPLNYAYLDALYLNYPLVHNASLIKNVGYYYDGFDGDTAKEQLIYALESHDKNMDEYNARSKKELEKYLPTNEHNIKIYDKLIDDIVKK